MPMPTPASTMATPRSFSPPSGSPNLLLNRTTNALNLWRFSVDWANTGATALTGPVSIPVAAYSAACSGGKCITQPGTSQKLDSLADRLMFRLAYRNFGDHEALVVTHSVTPANALSGIRWYELSRQVDGGSWTADGTSATTVAYRTVARWIAQGAKDDRPSPLVRLEVTPGGRRLGPANPGAQLRAIAHFADGTTREVAYRVEVPVERHYGVRIAPIAGADNDGDKTPEKTRGARAVVRLVDLTAAKRAEEMRADFAANASHELKTPLSASIASMPDSPTAPRCLPIASTSWAMRASA